MLTSQFNTKHSPNLIRFIGLIASGIFLFLVPVENRLSGESSEFFNAFVNDSSNILFALVCSMVVAVPFAVDLCFDFLFPPTSLPQKDLNERLFLLVYIFGPPLFVLIYKNSDDLSSVYSRAHICQHMGYLSVIYAFAMKTHPDFFVKPSFIFSFLLLIVSYAILLSAVYDGFSLKYLLGVLLLFLSVASFMVYCIKWMYQHVYLKIIKKTSIPLDSLPFILYLSVAMVSLVIIPSGIFLAAGLDFRNFNCSCILSFIVAYSSFNVLIGSIPGRIARFLVDLKSDALSENRRSLIRFFCHEIRSPLNVLSIGLSLFQVNKMDLDSLSILMDLVTECASATMLVNNLSDYEEIDSGNLKLRCQEESIETLRNAINSCEEIAKKRGTGFVFKDVTMLTEGEASDAVLHIDSGKIDQVIRTIFRNAMSFTLPMGSVVITLRVCYGPAASFLTIDFSSSDIGMSGENRIRLLQNFHAFDECALRGGIGSGLELWVAKKLIELHKGSVNITMSDRYKVTIVLPLKTGHGENPATSHQTPGSCCLKCPGLYTKVFAVDHEVNNLLDIEAIVAESPLPDLPILPTQSPMNLAKFQPVVSRPTSSHREKIVEGSERSKLDAPSSLSDIVQADISVAPLNERAKQEGKPAVLVGSSSTNNLEKILSANTASSEPSSLPEMKSDHMSSSRESDEHLMRVSSPSSDLAPAVEKKQLTFLVVDDSPLNRKFIIRTVRKLFDNDNANEFLELIFVEAADGVPAVDYIASCLGSGMTQSRSRTNIVERERSKEPLDAVLLDNIMTEMNGPEAAAAARKMGYMGPIVGITGNVLADDVRDFLFKGANHVLPKPIDVGGMKEVFRTLLPGHRDFIV